MKSLYDIRLAVAELKLPPDVREFRKRAAALAVEYEDSWATLSTQRATGVYDLISLARNRPTVVELGTASGWTAAAIVIANPECHVTTFDPVDRPHREEYWSLLTNDQRSRISYHELDGALGADSVSGVDLLFIDSSHDLAPTLAEFRAWLPSLAPAAAVVFDDYGHADFPGVKQAVEELDLKGPIRRGHFLWTAP